MTSTRLVSVLLAVGFLSGCAGPQMMANAQREAEMNWQVQRSRTLTEAGTQLLIHSQPPPPRTTYPNCHWLDYRLNSLCTTH